MNLKTLIQRNAKNKGLVKNAFALAAGELTIWIYDIIADGYCDAETIGRTLEQYSGSITSIKVRINSPGGDVFEARAIRSLLVENAAPVSVVIDGVCASAATQVAMSGNEISMSDQAQFMIHKSWTFAIGNANDLIKTAGLLNKIDAGIVADYARKTGMDSAVLDQMLTDETWFSADEALQYGFIDSINSPDSPKIEPVPQLPEPPENPELPDPETPDPEMPDPEIPDNRMARRLNWDLSAYRNAPNKNGQTKSTAARNQSEESELRERLRRRIRIMELTAPR